MAEEQQGQQGNVRQEFNLGRIGLNMDSTVNQIEKGKLTYALNANLENFDANSVNYQNEQGNNLCLNFPENYQLIGEHFIQEQNKHIFFLANPDTGDSEIGYMENNNCIYHTYINAPCLNFKIENPIHKAVHKITNCTTEIYWTDGLNPRRYLDLNPENIPYKNIQQPTNTCDAKQSNEIDCNKLKIQPNFEIPQLTINGIVNEGELKAGTYQFAIQYANASGVGYTSFYSVTNPTSIANPFNTTPVFDYTVGKSIVVNIDNLDITGYFQYYNLAAIKTINNITSVELIGTFNITNVSKQFIYSGQNQIQIPLTLAQIFEKFPYYDVAQDLTTVQDILVWDNLTSIDRINYQKIANQIELQWQTYRIPATENYSNELSTANLRGYLRDEVYAFEIVFLLKNGKQTDGFHIPGRVINYNELSHPDVPSTNPDFIGAPDYSVGEVGYSAYWKIYNTGSAIAYDQAWVESKDKVAYKGAYQYGDFAYWESSELYPCDPLVWGDLANQPIRHHKFPDVLVSPIFESATPTIVSGKYAVSVQTADAVFPIGVRLDIQQISQLIAFSDLTQEQKDNIESFKIVRGDRTVNKSIVGKGILRNVGVYEREGTSYYYPNYPYNDLNKDPFLLNTNNAYNTQCNRYELIITADASITYTSCNNNQRVDETLTVGTHYICSTEAPVINTGTGTFTKINGTSYLITVQFNCGLYDDSIFGRRCAIPYTAATFSYTDPVTLGTNTIEINQNDPTVVESTTVPVFVRGSIKYNIVQLTTQNKTCYPTNLEGFKTDASKYRMVFNSPDTSFSQPFLGNIIKMESAIYGAGRAHFVEVKKHALYRLLSQQAQIEALNSSANIASIGGFNATAMFTTYQAYLQIYINGITRKNYTYSFNSVANYDYSASIENNLGIKQRQLDLYQYLIPGVQNVGDVHNINNFERESSIYLKTIEKRDKNNVAPLPYAQNTPSLLAADGSNLITDNSRFTLKDSGNCGIPEYQEPINVVSYYGSIKNIYPNQWGQIYSYVTIDTGFQANIEPNNIINGQPSIVTIFGGDTFINKFAFKTKLPFFIDNRVGAPNDSDIFYDEIGNIAYPQYWYSSRSILYNYVSQGKTLNNIISIKAHNFDCGNDPTVSDYTTTTSSTTTSVDGSISAGSKNSYYDGKMYLFAYGIPNFYVESGINVDLRQAFNNQEGDFYPHVSTGIPDNWLQESVVPIAFDNTYYYNPTYSKQNTENYFSHLPAGWTPAQCYTNYPFRAIYSDTQESDPNTRVNNWLVYAPLASFDFPQNYGKLVSLDGIQNKAILARFENKSFLYNTMLTINTSNPQAAYLGNPSLFRSAPPIDFAETNLGYMGAQNKFLLKIPQGQISIDAKRGQIFLIAGNQATDISAFGSGVNRFMTDHLPFEILNYYSNADTDNHFNGIGIHGVYDSKYDRVIISKLDYIPQPEYRGVIQYDAAINKYYINKNYGSTVLRQYVDLTDIQYFCNKSWTLSFNMNTGSWVSFHSYIPNWYIAENNFFYSGLNEGCDLEALAIQEIPTPSTTTTTTTVLNCNLAGEAFDCTLDGTAINVTP